MGKKKEKRKEKEPSKKRKKDEGPKRPFIYPQALKFLFDIQASHTHIEKGKLSVGLEFPNLKLIKLELEVLGHS